MEMVKRGKEKKVLLFVYNCLLCPRIKKSRTMSVRLYMLHANIKPDL